MSEKKCQRCDEKFQPVSLDKDWPSRIRGSVTVQTYKVSWRMFRFGNIPGWDRPRITVTDMDFCDQCWGELLDWANRPGQERLKIASENRRRERRVIEVAEDRREREIRKLMKEGDDE